MLKFFKMHATLVTALIPVNICVYVTGLDWFQAIVWGVFVVAISVLVDVYRAETRNYEAAAHSYYAMFLQSEQNLRMLEEEGVYRPSKN